MSKTKEGENTSTHNTHNTPHSTHNTHNTHTRDLVLALLIALEEPKMIRFDFLIACLIDELQRLLAWRKNHEWCGKSSLVCFCGVVDRENRCFLVNVFHQSSCACHEGEKHTHKHKHKHKHKTTKPNQTKPNQTTMSAKVVKLLLVVVVLLLASWTGLLEVEARVGGTCTPSTGRDPPPEKAEDGIFFVETATDIDNLIAGCEELEGSLEVVCADDTISSLEVFRTVKFITGYLRVENCHNITDLNGFRNLQG